MCNACRDDDIALLAVEQLGSLAARLLSRTELSHSAHQVLVAGLALRCAPQHWLTLDCSLCAGLHVQSSSPSQTGHVMLGV